MQVTDHVFIFFQALRGRLRQLILDWTSVKNTI